MRHISLLVLVVLAGLAGCSTSLKSRPLSADEAKVVAVTFLNAQLKGKEYQDALGASHRYPEFVASDWTTVTQKEGRWICVIECLNGAGYFACVSMSISGDEQKLESYDFATE